MRHQSSPSPRFFFLPQNRVGNAQQALLADYRLAARETAVDAGLVGHEYEQGKAQKDENLVNGHSLHPFVVPGFMRQRVPPGVVRQAQGSVEGAGAVEAGGVGFQLVMVTMAMPTIARTTTVMMPL